MQKKKTLALNFLVIMALFLILLTGIKPLRAEVKIIDVPQDIQIEENTVKESPMANLSLSEIFNPGPLYRINDSLYLLNQKSQEIVKLGLDGKVLARLAKPGRGPGEFHVLKDMALLNGNLAILDSGSFKIVYYTPDLKYIDEVKLSTPLFNFFIDEAGQFVFFGNPSKDIYFEVFSRELKPLGKFAEALIPGAAPDRMLTFDSVACVARVPEEKGVWAAFLNRYDLRYYQKEKLAVEIKEKKGFFAGQEFKRGEKTFVMYKDKANYLAAAGDRLYYFYTKEWKMYCDVFDLKEWKILRRIKLASYFQSLAHDRDNVFYTIKYSDNEEKELQLVKLVL